MLEHVPFIHQLPSLLTHLHAQWDQNALIENEHPSHLANGWQPFSCPCALEPQMSAASPFYYIKTGRETYVALSSHFNCIELSML
jgi:hypothetical protein